MTHQKEEVFAEHVHDVLINMYGEEFVEKEKYLEDSGRYADFWVELGMVKLAIEVENDFDSIFTGVGQALLYASHEYGAIPVVIIPRGHVEEPEYSMVKRWVIVHEI